MNPLVSRINGTGATNPLQILSMLKNGNSDDVARMLCNTNPAFRKFYEANKGKSVDQICSENGIDKTMLTNLFSK